MIDQLMTTGDVQLSDDDRAQIERKVAKLDKMLTHWDQDTVWIRVALKPRQKSEGVHALITIGIPGATLVTEEESDSAVKAVGIAVDEMERELRKRKTRIAQRRRGPGVGEALAAEAAAAPDETDETNETDDEDYAPPAEVR